MKSGISKLEKTVAEALAGCGVGKVLLGISGGADSSALLLALLAAGAKVKAIHCNFHLRGEESDRDMRHVRELCASLGVDLDVVDFDVEDYMTSHKVSVEMACRELRYDYFRKCLAEGGFQRIAVAHNSDDNIETMFLNLFRGTGLKGLRGMLADTGEIIRPLLGVSRKEIEEYMQQRDVAFVNDSTNCESEYKRNFIRNEVIPMLESRWPGLRETLRRTMENVAMEDAALDRIEAETWGEDPNFISWDDLSRCPGGEWILRRFCARHGVSRPVTLEIIGCYSRLGRGCRGKHWIFSEGRISFGAEGIYFWKAEDSEMRGEPVNLFSFEKHSVDRKLMEKIRKSPNTELWIPFSPDRCRLRYVRRGDRISPLGMSGSKAVSDIIKESGVSPDKKERVVVAEDDVTGDIIWIEGMRRSRMNLIDNNTPEAWRIFRKNFAD